MSSSAVELLKRVLEILAGKPEAEPLIRTLAGGQFIPKVMQVLGDDHTKYPREQIVECARVLKELLVLTDQIPFDIVAQNPTDFSRHTNHNRIIKEELRKELVNHIDLICKLLTETSASTPKKDRKEFLMPCKFSSFKVRDIFSMYRFALMEVLVDAAMHFTSEVLDKIHPDAWLAFSNWFIDFSNNNLYQNLFYKLYHIAIKTRHIPSLKALFIRSKFLTKMIKHFLDTENYSGSKGMILLMANYLRLEADCDAQTDFIPNYLSAHEGWNDFLPVLKKETLYQLTSAKLEAPGGPQPQISPFFIVKIPHYKFNGTDLESNYANMLGVSKKHVIPDPEDTPPLR